MKKNNLAIISVLIIGASCTKAPVQETLISRWDKNSEKEVVLERALASTVQNQCLKEVFSVDTLKAEIEQIERKFAKAPRVRGSWRHLDLDQLPVPQANFLKDFGDQIGDLQYDRNDYTGCFSVPCIFNRIYGKEDHIAGYVHYLWYLKFGHMLSADNLIPVVDDETTSPGFYNGKNIPLDKYLYNDDELYGLWRLTLMLKSPQATLKELKEVQRIPRGEEFEGDRYKGACGLAYSRGWIKLTDGCLWQGRNNLDQGYLYQAVTHELNHHVDFEGGKGTSAFYRSHAPDYASVAGFKEMSEYVDGGRTIRKWEKSDDIKLVTNYAGTSPQENFAESLAMYRVDGDITRKKITEPHFNWVSQNYYQGRSFERAVLLKHWIDQYSLEISKAALNAVSDCNSMASSPKSVYFKASEFNAPVMPSMVNCIGNGAVDIAKMIRSKIAISEPEGCSALYESPGKDKWDGLIKSHLVGVFDKYLMELQKDKNYLARIQQFRKQLSDKKIAKDAYVNCFEENDEEACFNQEVQRNAYLKAEALNLPPEQTQELADLYVAQHSFANIKDETLRSYQQMVSGNLEAIREEAQYTWESCAYRSHDNDAVPKRGLFNVGSGFMISSFYNCLNSAIPDSIQNAVRKFSVGGGQLVNSKEEIILTREVQPRLLKLIQGIYEVEQDKEVSLALDYMYDDKGKLRSQVLSSYHWATNLIDSKQLVIDCRKEALKLIDMTLLFNTKSGLFDKFLETQTCANISESPEVNKWIEKSKDQFIEKVVVGLDERMHQAGTKQAQVCINLNPKIPLVGALLFKKKREACLKDAWDDLEDYVISEAFKDPIVKKLNLTSATLKQRLEVNRSEIQQRVIEENFTPAYKIPQVNIPDFFR